MHYDVVDGKRLELEALNGTVLQKGRELGISTPLNFSIYAALKPYIEGAPKLDSLVKTRFEEVPAI